MSQQNDEPKAIRTRNILDAAFLMGCGAQLLRCEQKGRFQEMVLSIEMLDKRGCGRRWAAMATDLQEGRRTLRDIMEDSSYTDLKTTYYKLKKRVQDMSDSYYDDEDSEHED